MSEGHHTAYGKIWWWLLILTVLEVAAAIYIAEPLAKGILLVGMALTKAILVALYFMHLRFERSTLLVIAFTPMIICAFLVFMLIPDLSAVVHSSSIEKMAAPSGGH
jgi:cytochrome c oxidase subunit 4